MSALTGAAWVLGCAGSDSLHERVAAAVSGQWYVGMPVVLISAEHGIPLSNPRSVSFDRGVIVEQYEVPEANLRITVRDGLLHEVRLADEGAGGAPRGAQDTPEGVPTSGNASGTVDDGARYR